MGFLTQSIHSVAPFVGAWIEIVIKVNNTVYSGSLPSWERGLKSVIIVSSNRLTVVAPFVGAWIEITIV